MWLESDWRHSWCQASAKGGGRGSVDLLQLVRSTAQCYRLHQGRHQGNRIMDKAEGGLARRAFLGLGALLAAAPSVPRAQAAPGDGEIIPLWSGRPPGAPSLLPEDRVEMRSAQGQSVRVAVAVGAPHMALVRPSRPTGAAMLLIPGGGYVGEWFDIEGYAVARRFAEAGVTSFVLRYRLPAGGWANRSEVPLQDAQRAVRLIRAGAAR